MATAQDYYSQYISPIGTQFEIPKTGLQGTMATPEVTAPPKVTTGVYSPPVAPTAPSSTGGLLSATVGSGTAAVDQFVANTPTNVPVPTTPAVPSTPVTPPATSTAPVVTADSSQATAAVSDLESQLQKQEQATQQEIAIRRESLAAAERAQEAEITRRQAEKEKKLRAAQGEESASSKALQFKLGREGTIYASEEGRKLKERQDSEISSLEQETQELIGRAKAALADNQYRASRELQAEAQQKFQNLLSLKQEQRQAQADDLNRIYKEQEMQKSRQEVLQKNADVFVSGLLSIDPSTGGVTMPDNETLQALSEQSGIPVTSLLSSTRTKAYELSKLSGEDRQRELAILKAQGELKLQGLSDTEKQWQNAVARGEVPKGTTHLKYLEMLAEAKASESLPASRKEWELAGGQAGTGKTYAEFLATGKGLDAKIAGRVDKIAGSFDNEPIVKNYNTVQEGFQTIKTIGVNTKSPADDISFIYAFAKIMDPNSVVREGEYNTIQKYAQTWADNFGFIAKRIFSNTNFLTPDAKQKMLNTLQPKIDTITQQYDNVYNEYGRRIDKVTDENDGKDYLTQYKLESTETPLQKFDDIYQKATPEEEKKYDAFLSNPAFGNTLEERKANILEWYNKQGKTNVGGDTQQASIKLGSKLAVANNNPGNLRYIGQPGAQPGKGGFARFSSPQAGVQALIDDLEAKKAPGGKLGPNSTLADLIGVYAPPSENDTKLYIQQLAQKLGVSPNISIKNINTKTLAKHIALKESSTVIS